MQNNESGGLPPGFLPVDSDRIDRSELIYILQKGVHLRLPDAVNSPGISVVEFLLEVLNLNEDSFKDEVRTMMRNNLVVDNPGETFLRSGDILVVSGAMPGLVGAMLRSDSPIKILRSTISGESGNRKDKEGALNDQPDQESQKSGFIKFKAFNTVLRDHLDDILRYGVYVEEPDE